MGNFQNLIETHNLNFGSAGTLSGSVYLGGNALIGIAAIGTWTASIMTLRVSLGSTDPNNGGTWLNVSPVGSAGTEYSVPAASLALGSLTLYGIPAADFPAVYWLQAKAGANAITNAGGTQQTAARSFVVFSRPI